MISRVQNPRIFQSKVVRCAYLEKEHGRLPCSIQTTLSREDLMAQMTTGWLWKLKAWAPSPPGTSGGLPGCPTCAQRHVGSCPACTAGVLWECSLLGAPCPELWGCWCAQVTRLQGGQCWALAPYLVSQSPRTFSLEPLSPKSSPPGHQNYA